MKILMHMPHVSLEVPNEFYEGLLITRKQFRKYNLEMCDLGIDELFKDYDLVKIIPKYSRLYCDVERFRDDLMEPMSKYGEGVVYTHLYDGIMFHKHDSSYKESVLKYYDEYHKNLDEIALKMLEEDDFLLILDCHSFSDKVASKFFEPPFPDICIGVEEEFYDADILKEIESRITELGYTYRINYPYKGSLTPNSIYKNKPINKKTVSIMIEINKRIYL